MCGPPPQPGLDVAFEQAHLGKVHLAAGMDGKTACDHAKKNSHELPKRQRGREHNPADATTQPAQNMATQKPVFCVKGPSGIRGAAKTRCALCSYECFAKELTSHEEKQHTEHKIECQTCHQTFSCSKSLRKHSRSRTHQILCIFMLGEERETNTTHATS